MAQRDYVARSQKKKQSPKKKKQAAQSIAWFKVAVAIAIVGGFVFGLWVLKDAGGDGVKQAEEATKLTNNKTQAPDESSLSELSAKAQSDEKDPLPVLAEEEWEFIEGLPSYSVEVEVEELPNSDRRYLMQCTSVQEKARAEGLKAKIAFQGLESQVLETKGSKGIWYRVVLGPYKTKRDADRDRHSLRSAGINGCRIWNWE
jgi:cell division protein FtsN